MSQQHRHPDARSPPHDAVRPGCRLNGERPAVRGGHQARAARTATLSLPSNLSSGSYQLLTRVFDNATPTPNLNTTGQETLRIKH